MNAHRPSSTRSRNNVGQLLIVGFDGTELTPRINSLLSRAQPAGVILFARNIETPEQTYHLLRACQKCVSTPLFTCVDLEGGSVDRFRNVLGPTPSAAEVFATGDRKLFRKHGELIGENCRALGFNVDFAPVLDLAYEASRSVMSSRAVSADPRKTAGYAREFLAGLRSAGVLGCGKHFPGLGEGNLDSHHELPLIQKPLRKMWSEDLLPYRLLHSTLRMVMISHAAYPTVTVDEVSASLSKVWITDILRKRIGYRNLIVSDDLEMGAVQSAAPSGQAAISHIRAGGDLCLVCHREDHVVQSYEGLLETVEREFKFADRVATSVERILAFKKKSAKLLRAARLPSQAGIARLSRTLWEFGEQVRLQAAARAAIGRKQPSRPRAG